MNKQELANEIAQKDNITQQEAIRRVDQLFDIIEYQLMLKNVVKIRNFGTFKTTIRNEKSNMNPKTKEITVVPKRTVPVFTASKTLKQKIQK